MATDGFLDLFLNHLSYFMLGLASVFLVFYWKPFFYTVRDACRAGKAHPKRKHLVGCVFLTATIWLLVAILYFRNMAMLWQHMTPPEDNKLYNRVVYMLLNSAMVVLVGLGAACTRFVSGFLYDHRQDLKDLMMIVKFRRADYHAIADLEAQEQEHAPIAESHAEDNIPQQDIPGSSSPKPDISNDDSIIEHVHDASSHVFESSPSPGNTIDADVLSLASFGTPLIRCPTCSSEHTTSIQSTRRASVREPLTPTSPAKSLGFKGEDDMENVCDEDVPSCELGRNGTIKASARLVPGKERQAEHCEAPLCQSQTAELLLGIGHTSNKDDIHTGLEGQVLEELSLPESAYESDAIADSGT